MNTYTPSLAVAATLLLTGIAYAQCPGGICRPTNPWRSTESTGLALDSRLSTLDSAPHCRIHVGDGSVGSGALISKGDSTATVLTCSHLFRDSTSNIIVTFPDGTRFGARLIERDPANDLAALLIRVPAASPLDVDDSNPTGMLTACGYGGDGRLRVVRGAITGASQTARASVPSLRIAATVRPGDSGGAVLNATGQLVGVVWGSGDGETYFTCGTPLRNFLHRLGERASARGDSSPTLDPNTWRTELEHRLAALDAKKQDRGDYLQPGDLNHYIRRDELTQVVSSETKQIQESTTNHIESLRTTILDRIEQRVDTASPGLLSGLSTGKLLAGALGLSGPVALAVMVAGAFASLTATRRRAARGAAERVDRSTVAGRPDERVAAKRACQPSPIAVDSPPPPQQTVPESHYVPVERDDFARAHQWAREQVARKYPGATEILSTLESLIKQQLAGNNV